MVNCEIIAWIGSENPYSPDIPEVHYIFVRGSYRRTHWLYLLSDTKRPSRSARSNPRYH